ncbi:adenylate/guanylate cyclase domain-containing protein [Lutimaribacter marinistellae]|uniref:Adenylate/guanylate cyclase domain-containing protein n=1 Tax=Lutimaribacter marinistellae TaxID=1820329 RepID=A0ABV7TIZ7_9RHOB
MAEKRKSSPDDMLGMQALLRSPETIVFVDVVDSVRLIDNDEEGTVRRWLGFVAAVEQRISGNRAGRIVKTLGDGLMLEFDDPLQAVREALNMREELAAINQRDADRQNMEIRIGMHSGDVLRGPDADLYGRDVNIAARLASTAYPGAIVASASVRDTLANCHDAEFEDIGPVYLKNVVDPVHAFRVVTQDEVSRVAPLMSPEDLLPTIAVLPFSTRGSDGNQLWGDMLADDLIAALSRSHRMNVISRLSTMAIRVETFSLPELSKALNADFLLSGSCAAGDTRHVLDIAVSSAQSGRIIWSDRIELDAAHVMEKNEIFAQVANDIHLAILDLEMKRAMSQPVPSLDSFEILMASVALMHRLSRADFIRAGELLDALIDRIPNNPVPLAWKSRWHVLKVVQGWSTDLQQEARSALNHTHRALDLDPTNSGALIAEGFVQTNLLHDLDEAEELYDSALEYTPNEATGRALRGTLYAFRGDGQRAVRDAERSLHLAPRDPHRFFFQCLAGSASLAAEDYPRALELIKSSLRLNRLHMSSLRMLAVTEWRLGNHTAARSAADKIIRLDPDFSISRWKRSTPSADFSVGQAFAKTLKEIGIPD